jgi:hypothetical protein
MRSHRRVYVVGGYIANGGTFMAYHLALIIQQKFDYVAVAVTLDNEGPSDQIQNYETVIPSVTLAEMEQTIQSDDVLIANPSFSLKNFGLRLNCRKLMYIQGFNTFQLLDMSFDRYVCVSDFVHQVMHATYGIESSVIPAFIQSDRFPKCIAWGARPQHTVLVHVKGATELHQLIFEKLKSIVDVRAPHIEFELLFSKPVPHVELIEKLGGYRYLLNLSVAEGFGLVPLEAMAMGALVIGFDGYGGRHYMRPYGNSLSVQYPDIDGIADKLIYAIDHPDEAFDIAECGRVTANEYTYARFADSWVRELQSFLGKQE